MLYERTIISKKPGETIKNELALLQQDQKLRPVLIGERFIVSGPL